MDSAARTRIDRVLDLFAGMVITMADLYILTTEMAQYALMAVTVNKAA
jgi:hypothetical protein